MNELFAFKTRTLYGNTNVFKDVQKDSDKEMMIL